jgi:NAD(P)-dependent dehydrogenase (short-subunit alcohol dehydrogenase family)
MTLPLQNKVAIITGANQGLGAELARAYLEAGANLMICARGAELLERTRRELTEQAYPGQRISALPADVSNEAEVAALVTKTLADFDRIDVLVNNAGVYGPKGAIEEVSWAEWVRAVEINLFGSVLACRAVLPTFKAAGKGKIIQLSGGGATSPLPMISAYAVSKVAVVRFVETLAEEVRSFHIDVNAIAPGPLNTRMLDEILQAGPKKVGSTFYERAVKQKQTGGASFKRGAALAVFLGSSQSDGITGKLLSAIWDPWESFDKRLQILNESDVYTLRRIVPNDRGLRWEEER